MRDCMASFPLVLKAPSGALELVVQKGVEVQRADAMRFRKTTTELVGHCLGEREAKVSRILCLLLGVTTRLPPLALEGRSELQMETTPAHQYFVSVSLPC